MNVKTKFLIKWPDRITLRSTMPFSFRHLFKQCAIIIIDCTEVLWSNQQIYLHVLKYGAIINNSTVKILIGITPQGTISYISKCYGGRISDKEIVEQSDMLNYTWNQVKNSVL